MADLAGEHDSDALPASDRAMLRFVVKLTRAPGEMERRDVEALSDRGFDGRAIHDIVLVAAYFAFVNRLADGLGVELEGRWHSDGDSTES